MRKTFLVSKGKLSLLAKENFPWKQRKTVLGSKGIDSLLANENVRCWQTKKSSTDILTNVYGLKFKMNGTYNRTKLFFYYY